jgi:ribosomal protein S27AE
MPFADDRDQEKERKCLRCATMFMSHNAANRICSKCKSSNRDNHMPSIIPVDPHQLRQFEAEDGYQ